MSDPLLGLTDRERESTLLLAIIEATAEGPGVEPLAAAVAKLIVAATTTDVCFVHVLDDTGQSLSLAGATPPFDREVGRVHLALGTGVTGWVAARRQAAVIVDHKESDPRYLRIPGLRGEDFASMASVPMASDLAGLVGVLNVHTRDRREFTERDIRLLTTIGSLLAGSVHLARLHRQVAQRERANERFAEQVVAAQEAERRRLASDIHDGISQRLVSLAYRLDAAGNTVRTDPVYAAEQVRLARELVNLTLDEARTAIGGLRPPVLDDLGLAGGLASLARSVPAVRCTLDLADIRLPEHVELALYRIAQEALQNVAKHASAGSAWVVFTVEPGMATLRVTDDGVGFDPSADPPGGPDSESYGLASMAWRAELVGGDLDVTSRPGRGTMVTARVPAR
ncbi:MAG TPA: GAF domain-containing sensor histidine kinase [Pseudonocardiaceae bacterium]|nr:GAF domain-containing sensor histidine kinase [Pseudonocardiaceae bacterium]